MTFDPRSAGVPGLCLVLLCFLPFVSPQAVAIEDAFYGGAGVLRADADDFCDGVFGRCDDAATGWRVFAGYWLHPNLALEVGYMDLGRISLDGEVPGLEEFGVLGVRVDSTAAFVAAVGAWRVTPDFALFGRLGAAQSRAEFTIWGLNFFEDDDPERFSESGVDLVAGFGLEFRMGRNVSLRAEWERLNNVGDTDENFTLISGSLLYRF
jgi:OmpA-OmpF porin, OOP family